MAEDAVADVVAVIEPTGLVVQPVHADVVKQGANTDQVGVEGEVCLCHKLFGDAADDFAVGEDEVQRLMRWRVPLVQRAYLVHRRKDHFGSVLPTHKRSVPAQPAGRHAGRPFRR